MWTSQTFALNEKSLISAENVFSEVRETMVILDDHEAEEELTHQY